ncbi:MAG: hypothetical protein H6R14_402 [Proteobacteria bacterium]|nr:hypothetical protein [Pseudomonadota bacterium]
MSSWVGSRMIANHTLFRLALLGLLSQSAIADSWQFDPVEKSKVETFGDLKIVQTTDARNNRQYPDFLLSVYFKDELLAKYKGVSFQKLFASPDNSSFVGLSNRGLPGTAIVVFDSKGNLLLEVKHGLAAFDYCDESVTLVRRWYDEDKPDVEFVPDEKYGGYKEIKVRDCRGKSEDLLKLVLRAYNNSFQRTTASHGR